jgi:phosphate uptake regulator/aminoglycoside phosphotransferase
MKRFGDLETNLRFLVIEVTGQVERTLENMPHFDEERIVRIRKRDNYIDQLKTTIENKCFSHLRSKKIDKKSADLIRAILVTTSNLERIADQAVDILEQTRRMDDPAFIERYNYRVFFETVIEALRLVGEVFEDGDTGKVLRIAEAEIELDDLFRIKYERILTELYTEASAQNLVSSLFIFQLLERMGDSLQNIAEAMLLYKTGDRLKIREYEHLRDSLASSGEGNGNMGDIELEAIVGTRSGSTISKVSGDGDAERGDRQVIFKEGELEKIGEEKEKIELWRAVDPSIPPRIVDYRESGSSATLLVEFLEGRSLQEILLNPETDLIDEALAQLIRTLHSVWTQTKELRQERADFLSELRHRVDEVYQVHPSFYGERKQINGLEIPNFPAVLEANARLDSDLVAPFSVFCHGDFNIDNIIYDGFARQIHFIDLRRSQQMDYSKDVSVFLVSNFRLPVFDGRLRARIDRVISEFYRFARVFAATNDDETFQARLALGLARSFATSTRFELQSDFASSMLGRSKYLLDKVSGLDSKSFASFTIPEEVLFY